MSKSIYGLFFYGQPSSKSNLECNVVDQYLSDVTSSELSALRRDVKSHRSGDSIFTMSLDPLLDKLKDSDSKLLDLPIAFLIIATLDGSVT